MKSKANQIYLKLTKIIQDVMSIHYQKNKLQKDYMCDYNWGGGGVLSVCFQPLVSSW
jgi:hypothetical protein